MVNWNLQEVKVKDIKEYEKNPRQISKEQLKLLEDGIKKFGLIDKPILNKDLTLIGGHQRLKVLKRLKIKSVECWVADEELSEKEFEQLCIQLNKATGDWNYDVLANEWEVGDLLDWGFTEDELFGTVKKIEDEENDEEEGKENNKQKSTICPSCGHEF